MNSAAFFTLIIVTAGFFLLDREKTAGYSKALWVPVIWLWIIGSRPVSVWMGATSTSRLTVESTLEGSSTDAFVFAVLVVLGLMILRRRKAQTRVLMKGIRPVLIYFAYCLISALWSPFTAVVLKRWIKAIGDLMVGLVIATEAEPKAALRRIFPRVGFLLLPASIFMIKYSPLGRGYDPDGNPMNVGVTTNKNNLGLITFIIGLGAVWNLLALFRDRDQPNRGRRLLSQGALVGLSLVVLQQAHSATSIACFALGTALMVITSLRWVRASPGRMNATVLTLAIVSAIGMVFGADELVLSLLGRDASLTGRTEIWKTVVPLAGNPLIGMGFESFWNNINRILRNDSSLSSFLFSNLNSAHNGYIEVYLNLGWVGVCCLLAILIGAYRRASSAFDHDPDAGGLMLAFLVTAAIYSFTEAGFRMLTPTWIFLLLAFVFSTRISSKNASALAPQSARMPGLMPLTANRLDNSFNRWPKVNNAWVTSKTDSMHRR